MTNCSASKTFMRDAKNTVNEYAASILSMQNFLFVYFLPLFYCCCCTIFNEKKKKQNKKKGSTSMTTMTNKSFAYNADNKHQHSNFTSDTTNLFWDIWGRAPDQRMN